MSIRFPKRDELWELGHRRLVIKTVKNGRVTAASYNRSTQRDEGTISLGIADFQQARRVSRSIIKYAQRLP